MQLDGVAAIGLNARVAGKATSRRGPTIAGLPSSCSLWPPNHKMVKVATVKANDELSGLASFTVSNASNEPAMGGENDVVITKSGGGLVDVQLRADRLECGDMSCLPSNGNGEGCGRQYSHFGRDLRSASRSGHDLLASCTAWHDVCPR